MRGEAGELSARLRALPGVDRVIAALADGGPPAIVADAARRAVDAARARVRAGADASLEEIVAEAGALLRAHRHSLLTPVINATGVLIHTNLGRVPLGDEQIAAVARMASGYSNLEYDLEAGRRGTRYSHAQRLLTALTGAEAALVVNNNAAAVLITLAALCAGREVIISRGELIEIGGEFRIPDVMAASGARLVEVGTTNRTHMGDYERAIGADTAAILKVHPSNYKVVGFTASVSSKDLARLARGRGVCFIHDAGSGYLGAPGADQLPWLAPEPVVEHALADGADLVTFSGDKLLGGPQAGIITGRRDLIDKIGHHPLLRAVRVDKMTLAALEATLSIYLEGRLLALPLWESALASNDELEARAHALARAVTEQAGERGVKAEAVASRAVTGGGSLPGAEMSSWALAVTHAERSTTEIESALRAGSPPVIARIEDDRLLLDLRTVPPSADATLQSQLLQALSVF